MADESARAAMVPVDRIRMHPRNIRKTFTGLDELEASIRHEGVLEPLVAHQKARRAAGVQDLELIAGHRRLAAAEQAGLSRVPVFIVPTMRDDEAMLAMLAENVQREAVPVPDLGRAITELHDEFGYDFGSIAERLGITLEVLREWRQGRELRPSAAPEGRASARKLRSDAGRPAARPIPKFRPSAVHDLVQQFDAGQLDADAIVAELRSWLGDWKPAEKPKPPPRPRARLGRRRRPRRRPSTSLRRPTRRSARGGAQVEQQRHVRPADRRPHRAEPTAGRPAAGRPERNGSSVMTDDIVFVPLDVRPIACGDPVTAYEGKWLAEAHIPAERQTRDVVEAYRVGYADGTEDDKSQLDQVRAQVDRKVERAVHGYRSEMRALARRDFAAARNALAEDDSTRASVRVIVQHLGGGTS